MKKRYKGIRPAIAFGTICVLFACLSVRIAYIENSTYRQASAEETQKTVTLASTRGMIYDCNGLGLVNTEQSNLSVLITAEQTEESLKKVYPDGLRDIPYGKCIWLKTDTPIAQTPLSTGVTVYERYASDGLACHIIGYTDASGKGVAGIERSFDRILAQASGTLRVQYETDVYGTVLAGTGLNVVQDNYASKAGVALTIDSRIQKIVEEALENSSITQGAAVVMQANSGNILAIASVPKYDVNHLSASLNDATSPFLNRALNCYPVGSVFKPFVAAACLLNDKNADVEYVCNGSIDVNTLSFHCYNGRAHSTQHLCEAICNSCNCYFIAMGQSLGAQALTQTCRQFGFGKEIKLTGDIVNVSGCVPESDGMSNGELANLCFGQGKLLASPLQLCAAFNTLASDGVYYTPVLMKNLVDDNGQVYAYYENENCTAVLLQGTADIINRCLYSNMLSGTGVNGNPDNTTAAGKTATAQTGKYNEDGNEILCTWFCGFFPYENPRYTVVVFNENGDTASVDCAPVFKQIAENIAALFE